MESRQIAELVLVIFSLGIFTAYHLWLFLIRGKATKVKSTYHDFFQAGKLARAIWAEACATSDSEAILGVQQARNAMSACVMLATISVAIATAGITLIFDDAKIARIRVLAENDPIMRHLHGPVLVPPTAILAMALGSLYASFVLFAHSVRLYVHVGFYVRACSSQYNPGTLTVAEARRVTIRAGMAFSIGLRLFYAFIPLVMWSVGVTALVVSSVAMTAMVASMDHFDMPEAPAADEEAPLAAHAAPAAFGAGAGAAGPAVAARPPVLLHETGGSTGGQDGSKPTTGGHIGVRAQVSDRQPVQSDGATTTGAVGTDVPGLMTLELAASTQPAAVNSSSNGSSQQQQWQQQQQDPVAPGQQQWQPSGTASSTATTSGGGASWLSSSLLPSHFATGDTPPAPAAVHALDAQQLQLLAQGSSVGSSSVRSPARQPSSAAQALSDLQVAGGAV